MAQESNVCISSVAAAGKVRILIRLSVLESGHRRQRKGRKELVVLVMLNREDVGLGWVGLDVNRQSTVDGG